MSIYFISIVTLLGAAQFRYRSIRALCRPISPCGLNTGFWLRLLPVGQYAFAVALSRPAGSIRALVALFRPAGSIRALVALFRPAGSIRALCRPGLRYAYPGLYSGAPSGRFIPPSPNLTSACGRCPFPLSIYGEGVRG